MLPSRFYEDMLDVLDNNSNKGMNCDIYEENGVYHMEMDIPGFKKNEVNIECHKGTITVRAKKEYNNEEHSKKKFIRHERRYSEVERSFYLGDIDEENVKATFVDGTLKVTVPTKQEQAKKHIEIE